MSGERVRVPLLLRVAVWLLPAAVREEVLGDLLEHWRSDVCERPWHQRVVWLTRQPIAVAVSRVRYGSGVNRRPGIGQGEGRGLWFSWLDVKLGVRMMVKHPGVSVVIVFALALGIPASLAPHHVIDAFMDESPPFDEGDRVVGLLADGGESGRGESLRLGDYELLRERLTTFAFVGAARRTFMNVIGDDGASQAERVALMTASAFALTRVPPLMGRPLSAADEVTGAPDVVVIGYDFWRSRLGGAVDVVGTTIRVAGVLTTIVGVMPDGFAMPSVERLWLPLRLRSVDYEDGLGPPVEVYGRLDDGASLAQAQAELSVVGVRERTGEQRAATSARAVAFSALAVGEPDGVMWFFLAIAQTLPLVFLLVACGNVGILLLARTATRTGEVAIRTALGASRARIVGQLFVEALLLALVATGVGLVAVDLVLNRVEPPFALPFWLDLGVTPELVIKALSLAVFSAVIAGVLPALRATGTALHRTLQSAGSSGGTLRFGRLVGALIVVEVALGVGALYGGAITWHLFQPTPDAATRAADAGRYLVARISIPSPELPEDDAALGSEGRRIRVASTLEDLGRRLDSEPGIHRWAFSDAPPGEERDERRVRMNGDGQPAGFPGLPGVATFVDPDFFRVLDVTPVQGRLFDDGDVPLNAAASPTAVIVNMKFLERRGLNPGAVGRAIRFTYGPNEPPGPWMEIVGVVPNLVASEDRVFLDGTPVVYLAAPPGSLNPATLVVDAGGDPVAFTPRLRTILAETDPAAIVDQVDALDELPNDESTLMRIATSVMGGLSLIAIVLSTAALYALMSLTVSQRTREIGIRVALGGRAGQIITTVARRALVQLGLGVALGAGVWAVALLSLIDTNAPDELSQSLAVWPWLLFATVGIVVAIGLAACLVPTLRGLRIRPVEALRVDG